MTSRKRYAILANLFRMWLIYSGCGEMALLNRYALLSLFLLASLWVTCIMFTRRSHGISVDIWCSMGCFPSSLLSLHRASFQLYPRAWLILTPCICIDKRTSLNLKRGMLYIWCLGDVQRAVGGREYLLCWQNTRKSMRWRSCLPFEYPIPKTVSPRFHMYKLLSERKKEFETIIWKRQLNRK